MLTLSIPTRWSTKIKRALDKALVYVQALTNRDYEGELKGPGDSVKLVGVGNITISTFTGTLADPEDVSDTDGGTLVADQSKSFHFFVDDLNSQRSIINAYNEFSQRAAYGLSDTVDQYIASFHSSVSATTPDLTYGDSTTPIVIGFGSGEIRPYDAFLELNQRLDEANVPTANRRVVLPPWMWRAIKKELSIKDTAGAENVIINGFQQNLDNAQIFVSNNVPNTAGAKFKVLFGLPVITYADVISKTETYRPEKKFGVAVKGLHVYGANLVYPEQLALGTFNKGTLSTPNP